MKIIISISYICDEDIHFQHLDRANTVTMNFKHNVLCCLAFIYGITTIECIFRSLSSVILWYILVKPDSAGAPKMEDKARGLWGLWIS